MQDTLVKVKGVISEEKKHIRFADWSAHDVSRYIQKAFIFWKQIIQLFLLLCI